MATIQEGFSEKEDVRWVAKKNWTHVNQRLLERTSLSSVGWQSDYYKFFPSFSFKVRNYSIFYITLIYPINSELPR